MVNSTILRKKFLDFFRHKDHYILPSHSLIPRNDSTLLWINCGMAPLKPYYSKKAVPPSPRMANSQKSLRTNDIDNVGKTNRHHTMFEMLGNFSIGDYFKEEVIPWAWEFLTKELSLDVSKLYVTIHPEDDEAFQIWTQKVGLDPSHIIRDPENFWEIGPGPCGPNSEIYYDRGDHFPCDNPHCQAGCDCDRYLEIWNLVFTQYNRETDGGLTELPNKNIDTGMSLERLASIVQNVESNYETDLFMPLINKLTKLSGKPYDAYKSNMRIIVDHIRAITFAIADGAMPSNEGRGYIIRRLLRRAVRYGRQLGFNQPFLYKLVDTVIDIMDSFYTYLPEKQQLIERIVKNEELRFLETLEDGEKLLSERIAKLKEDNLTIINGEDVFKLYDTFGFPLELTIELATEEGFEVDVDGFEEAMNAQRARARQARETQKGNMLETDLYTAIKGGSDFVGYHCTQNKSSILALSLDGELVNRVNAKDQVEIILAQTPFYAESGGQVADKGVIQGPHGTFAVADVQKLADGKIIHRGTVSDGFIDLEEEISASIDKMIRRRIMTHHSVTHLLHKALKNVLGTHVNQAGSQVDAHRLRFDFTHFSAITTQELQDIQAEINKMIFSALEIETNEMDLEKAKALGATALFGEKYGAKVRVVTMSDYSMELCGGTHLRNTAEAGMCIILSESSIGSGIRRIEAVAGQAAYELFVAKRKQLDLIGSILKVTPLDIHKRIMTLVEHNKELLKSNEQLQQKLSMQAANKMTENIKLVEGIKVLSTQVEAQDMKALRQAGDAVKEKINDAVIVLGSATATKVNLLAIIPKKLVSQHGLHAGKLVNEVAKLCDGRGGGRPNMAQAGGNAPASLPSALTQVQEFVRRQLI